MQPTPAASLKYLPLAVLAAAAIAAAAYFAGNRGEPMPVISQIGSFQLTNQSGELFSSARLSKKVWAAQIIFTRCPGPCLRMAQAMEKLRQHYASEPRVAFVSLTSDPEFDGPAVLKAYAAKIGAAGDRWQFLTGPKKEIYRLAVDDLKLTAVEKSEAERASPDDLFIHSTISVIVDSRGRVRAAVEALEPEGPAQLKAAIDALLKE